MPTFYGNQRSRTSTLQERANSRPGGGRPSRPSRPSTPSPMLRRTVLQGPPAPAEQIGVARTGTAGVQELGRSPRLSALQGEASMTFPMTFGPGPAMPYVGPKFRVPGLHDALTRPTRQLLGDPARLTREAAANPAVSRVFSQMDESGQFPGSVMREQLQNPEFVEWAEGQERAMRGNFQESLARQDFQERQAQLRQRIRDRQTGRRLAALGITPADMTAAGVDPALADRMLGTMPRMSPEVEDSLARRLQMADATRRMAGRVDARQMAPGARFAPGYPGDRVAALQAPAGGGGAGAMMSVPDAPGVPAGAVGGGPVVSQQTTAQMRPYWEALRSGDISVADVEQQLGARGLTLREIAQANPGDRGYGRGFRATVETPEGRLHDILVGATPDATRYQEQPRVAVTPSGRRVLTRQTDALMGQTGLALPGSEEGQSRLAALQGELDERRGRRQSYFEERAGRSGRPYGRAMTRTEALQGPTDDTTTYRSPSGPPGSATEQQQQIAAATQEAQRIAGGETFAAMGFDSDTSPVDVIRQVSDRVNRGGTLSDMELREIYKYMQAMQTADPDMAAEFRQWPLGRYFSSTRVPTVDGLRRALREVRQQAEQYQQTR